MGVLFWSVFGAVLTAVTVQYSIPGGRRKKYILIYFAGCFRDHTMHNA